MNVASTAGFQPLARQSTYSASKAFVLSFTEVLSSDLKGTGVTATALCPGPSRRSSRSSTRASKSRAPTSSG